MTYLTLKWLHVLSSTILFGTGLGSAYYLLVASLSRDTRIAAHTVRWVVWADWLFTTTTVFIQPITGLALASMAGIPLTAPWLLWSIVLYLMTGACWLPVVWIQIRMRALAEGAMHTGGQLPARYFRLFRIWLALGICAFTALAVTFYLMVVKPG